MSFDTKSTDYRPSLLNKPPIYTIDGQSAYSNLLPKSVTYQYN